MRVLVIEDETLQRDALLELLRMEGHQALGAANIREAGACLRSDSVDVILLDLRLPDSSGLDALEALRVVRGTARVVVTTGMAMREALPDGRVLDRSEVLRRAGADAFVSKPIDFDELLPLLRGH